MTTVQVDYATGEIVGLPEDSTPGVRIADVVIGERARKDYGDLTDLMESIRQHGLLQPIGVLPGNRLLFGGRRLEACRRLGWESIPYTRPHTQDHALALLKAERDENTCRKDMTPTELISLGMRIEDLARPAAEARIREAADRGRATRWDGPGSAEPSPSTGQPSRTAIEVGAALGISPATYKRGKHVMQTAGDPTLPETVRLAAAQAVEEMAAGGTITAAYNKVCAARKAVPVPAPVSSPDKSRAAVAARIEQAQELARTGRTSAQIAHAIGMSEASAKEMFRRERIEVPADKVVGKARRLDANRVVEQTVRAAEPSPELLAAINYGDLDPALLGEWISSLSESLKALRSLKTTLERELSRVSE